MENADGVRLAAAVGAARVELCAALAETDGVTPGAGAVEQACAAGLPVHVLVRPRPGGFDYTADELAVIELDVSASLRAGAAGVVVGVLAADGGPDEAATRRIVAAARRSNPAAEVTFHRAFDAALAAGADPAEALSRLGRAGVHRVLTSGGAPDCVAGLPMLRRLVALTRQHAPSLQIMAGGGVTAELVPSLVAAGVHAIHTSARDRTGGSLVDGRSVPSDPDTAAAFAAALTPQHGRRTTNQETFSMSTEITFRGRIVTATADIGDGVVASDGGLLTYAGPASEYPGVLEPMGAGDASRVIIPGLVDLHCHGALGSDFSEGSADAARAAAQYLHSRGTTTLLASLVTGTPEDLLRNVRTLRTLAAEELIAGSHLEGPFLSGAQCGAHDPALLLAPDLGLMARLLEAAGDSLASVTLAAELPGASGLVDLLTAHGVIPSLGHTAADNPTAAAFLARAAAGLSGPAGGHAERRPTVTHLFNAMPSLHHRAPGPVAASLAAARAGGAVVELIADGVHLAPQTVKLVFDLLGSRNIALVTDSMAATGLQDGRYRLGSLAVTVDQGVARVDSTGSIAGGTATLLDVVRSAVAAGVDLQDAVASATAVPASVLGLAAQAGDLRAGMPADVVVLDQNLNLESVLRRGNRLPRPGAA